jgi:hypothetical protein
MGSNHDQMTAAEIARNRQGDTRPEPYRKSRTPLWGLQRIRADLAKAKYRLDRTLQTVESIIVKMGG